MLPLISNGRLDVCAIQLSTLSRFLVFEIIFAGKWCSICRDLRICIVVDRPGRRVEGRSDVDGRELLYRLGATHGSLPPSGIAPSLPKQASRTVNKLGRHIAVGTSVRSVHGQETTDDDNDHHRHEGSHHHRYHASLTPKQLLTQQPYRPARSRRLDDQQLLVKRSK